MRVALLHDSVLPVKTYGGIERVVQSLCEELPKLGHKVLLISREAPGSSDGNWLPPNVEQIRVPSSIYRSATWWSDIQDRISGPIDFLHSHQPLQFRPDTPHLVTIHGNAQPGEVFGPATSFVSRSHALNHNAELFVYNGVDPARYPFVPKAKKKEHFVFLAKASWSVKNLASAIAFAEHHKVPLEVIGGTGSNTRYVTYRGVIGEAEGKLEILSTARALLYPTNWQEPFGIAVIEAMACGVPVIASVNGAMPELVAGDVGVTCEDYHSFIDSFHRLAEKSSEACRARVEQNFTTALMARAYADLYARIASDGPPAARPRYTERLRKIQRIYKPTIMNWLRYGLRR